MDFFNWLYSALGSPTGTIGTGQNPSSGGPLKAKGSNPPSGSTAVRPCVPGVGNLFGLTCSSCPGGQWYERAAVYLLMGMFILFGILGVVFGNKEVDKTVIETVVGAAAA